MLKRFSIYSFFNAPIAQKSTLKEKFENNEIYNSIQLQNYVIYCDMTY